MIRMMPDVGAPLLVTAVNIGVRQSMPQWHDMVIYGMCALGYASDFFRLPYADTLKNVGISSLPLAADKIYERIKGGTVGRPARTYNRARTAGPVQRYPGASPNDEFANVNLY